MRLTIAISYALGYSHRAYLDMGVIKIVPFFAIFQIRALCI